MHQIMLPLDLHIQHHPYRAITQCATCAHTGVTQQIVLPLDLPLQHRPRITMQPLEYLAAPKFRMLDDDHRIQVGDCRDLLRDLPAKSVQCCVTSVPYYQQRDYQMDGQIGLEATVDEYIVKLVGVFREVKRVLRDDGTLWLNIDDTYGGRGGGVKGKTGDRAGRTHTGTMTTPRDGRPKELLLIPGLLAEALRADGWYVRSQIIWAKTSPRPESVKDRPTHSHEFVFLLSKAPRYYYDYQAVREPAVSKGGYRGSKTAKSGANGNRRDGGRYAVQGDGKRALRDVWKITPTPFPGAHHAVMPITLALRCILAGCPLGGIVLDPFGGVGTTALAAKNLGRRSIIMELNPEYAKLAEQRLQDKTPAKAHPAKNEEMPLLL